MRLEGRIKMGYHPTPLSVIDRARYFLLFPEDRVNFLDPCCGEGLALKNLVKGHDATTYGVELDNYRAGQAKANLDHVLKGSYEDARISNAVFSCLFLNPPYDWNTSGESNSERKEKSFLRGTLRYLQPKGVLIYIVPQKRVSLHRIPFVKCGRLTKFNSQAVDRWIKENTVRQERFDSLPCEQRATLTIVGF